MVCERVCAPPLDFRGSFGSVEPRSTLSRQRLVLCTGEKSNSLTVQIAVGSFWEGKQTRELFQRLSERQSTQQGGVLGGRYDGGDLARSHVPVCHTQTPSQELVSLGKGVCNVHVSCRCCCNFTADGIPPGGNGRVWVWYGPGCCRAGHSLHMVQSGAKISLNRDRGNSPAHGATVPECVRSAGVACVLWLTAYFGRRLIRTK